MDAKTKATVRNSARDSYAVADACERLASALAAHDPEGAAEWRADAKRANTAARAAMRRLGRWGRDAYLRVELERSEANDTAYLMLTDADH